MWLGHNKAQLNVQCTAGNFASRLEFECATTWQLPIVRVVLRNVTGCKHVNDVICIMTAAYVMNVRMAPTYMRYEVLDLIRARHRHLYGLTMSPEYLRSTGTSPRWKACELTESFKPTWRLLSWKRSQWPRGRTGMRYV